MKHATAELVGRPPFVAQQQDMAAANAESRFRFRPLQERCPFVSCQWVNSIESCPGDEFSSSPTYRHIISCADALRRN